ncbi:MAG: circularly permuted type 2 ATP-grasp protein [Pseudomonadales bacterium]|nr:circularly permuted type 2 ATP-grasp protein [Pseudomonadales bacterium]
MNYSVPAGLVDEVHAADGSIKPQWAYLLASLGDLGPQVLQEREEKAQRILRDDGATYNLHGEDVSPSNTWELDAVPYIIGSDDWARIEAGLLERAELFNLLLRDIYGPRTLLRHGALPPEALFSHSGFLRACQGIRMPGDHELILHAADMVRRRDGSMCVLSDRTQAPSGAGYVLENRTVMSRVFPSLYRDSHVHRIASFYQRLRLKLTTLSPSDDLPCIVLLTQGGRDEARFEYAYLANYLGLPLVQSGDLMVRNGFLWMKSMEGLTRVDVVLRRVDDSLCDPVELRSNSRMGVPGLLEVARNGRVVIANPLGSGILENPVLLKYLPEISKALLGREPRLASVKTYWCADEDDLRFVSANIQQLIIKPIYRGSGITSVWGGSLSADQQRNLLATIHRTPHQFVGQERLEKSHIPTFSDMSLQPRPAILRTFSVATDSSYMVMPGGMTRIGDSPGGLAISMQSGSPSKDTWVTATEPERNVESEAIPEALRMHGDASLVSLPSRVVENLYWMGRYAERAEAGLRLLRTVFVQLNGEEPISTEATRILLEAVTRVTGTQPGFIKAPASLLEEPDEELLKVIQDGTRVGSIRSTLNSMLTSAEESKELLSTDTQRVINDLQDELDSLDAALSGGLASAPEEALDPLVTGLVALSGLMQESMVRGVGWRFMELGKRVERAEQIITTLRILTTPVAGEAAKATLLTALLTTMDVLITYRRRARQRPGIALGLELVMLDPSNPRSLLFQLERLQQHLAELPGSESNSGELEEEERALLAAVTRLKLARLAQLLEKETRTTSTMGDLLQEIEKLLLHFNTLISDKHFDHRTEAQQLVATTFGTVS